jgi:hypothetical protein
MNKVQDLIKLIPDDLKKDAAVALKEAQQKLPEGTLLETVLEEAESSTQTAPPPKELTG